MIFVYAIYFNGNDFKKTDKYICTKLQINRYREINIIIKVQIKIILALRLWLYCNLIPLIPDI